MDIFQVLISLGMPPVWAGIVIVALWLAVRGARWLRDQVVVPLVEAHRRMIDHNIETGRINADANKRNAEAISRQTELLSGIHQTLNGLACRNGEMPVTGRPSIPLQESA